MTQVYGTVTDMSPLVFRRTLEGPRGANLIRTGDDYNSLRYAGSKACAMQALTPPNPPGSVDLSAAGGVVWRRSYGGVEVVVCHRSWTSLWALPKGKPNLGELPEATALREVHEETGLDVDIGPLIGEVRYSFHRQEDGAICNKVVRFFLMSPSGGDVTKHDAEFDQVIWLPAREAASRLTYANEARIIEKAEALAEATA
ncbi:MAG: NUDIX hydrolase [Dehalococcoidia bacterium]|nr:NUDIX hydrolase [Dehalococcoidia bacterium]